jgi:hypothetical protein
MKDAVRIAFAAWLVLFSSIASVHAGIHENDMARSGAMGPLLSSSSSSSQQQSFVLTHIFMPHNKEMPGVTTLDSLQGEATTNAKREPRQQRHVTESGKLRSTRRREQPSQPQQQQQLQRQQQRSLALGWEDFASHVDFGQLDSEETLVFAGILFLILLLFLLCCCCRCSLWDLLLLYCCCQICNGEGHDLMDHFTDMGNF